MHSGHHSGSEGEIGVYDEEARFSCGSRPYKCSHSLFHGVRRYPSSAKDRSGIYVPQHVSRKNSFGS
jgi:hypothetical protein